MRFPEPGDVMRKMKLDVAELVVESCAALDESTELRGTVQGNVAPPTVAATCYTCGGATCVYTGSPCVYC